LASITAARKPYFKFTIIDSLENKHGGNGPSPEKVFIAIKTGGDKQKLFRNLRLAKCWPFSFKRDGETLSQKV
jgi:hypothetical protein